VVNRGAPREISIGFPPIARPDARALILGSLPGRKSLEMRQYYAQPQNGFWRIMDVLFGAGPALAYPARVERLVECRVAVWDVLAAGERSGSLDSSIVETSVVTNDFGAFFERHPEVRLVCFNGTKAAELYRRRVLPRLEPTLAALETIRLPSTSPAHASLRFEQKLAHWSAALRGVARAAGDD
jgi:hypoxanthine-DNA glycosylase